MELLEELDDKKQNKLKPQYIWVASQNKEKWECYENLVCIATEQEAVDYIMGHMDIHDNITLDDVTIIRLGRSDKTYEGSVMVCANYNTMLGESFDE